MIAKDLKIKMEFTAVQVLKEYIKFNILFRWSVKTIKIVAFPLITSEFYEA